MTERSRLVVRDSLEVARECGHGSIEAPHLLLAILRATDTKGHQALNQAGLRYDDVLSTVKLMYDQPAQETQLPFGADARTLFEILVREAVSARRIETAHLALACSHGDKLPSLKRFVAGREPAIRRAALSGLCEAPDPDADLKRAGARPVADVRADALRRANEVRTRRAQLKRALKAGDAAIHTLLLGPPPQYIQRAQVSDVLLSLPRYGPKRVNRLLSDCAILPTTTIGRLSQRQREALIERLRPDD